MEDIRSKQCLKCFRTLPITNANFLCKRGKFLNVCKPCNNAYFRAYNKAHRITRPRKRKVDGWDLATEQAKKDILLCLKTMPQMQVARRFGIDYIKFNRWVKVHTELREAADAYLKGKSIQTEETEEDADLDSD